jgi:hypothetical protein
MNNNICIFTCALNEERYISEWCYYHFKIGIDKIFICDTSNNFSLNNHNVSKDSRIKLIHKPNIGEKFDQVKHINDHFNNEKNNFKWCAQIDCDEFIVLKKHSNIKDFLNSINLNSGCLGINWVLFGSNNQQFYVNKPVINRFTKCEKKCNKHIKCISVMKDVYKHVNMHYPLLKNGRQVNENNKNYKSDAFQENSSTDYIQINHYVLKSKEEFNKRNNVLSNRKHINYFDEHNKNDITDLRAVFIKSLPSDIVNMYSLDWEFYINYYDDLLVDGIFNKKLAIEHYNNFGKHENRKCNLSFCANKYRNAYPDLVKNGCISDLHCWNHWKRSIFTNDRKFFYK